MSDSIYSNMFCRIVFSLSFSHAHFLQILCMSSFPEYRSPIGFPSTPALIFFTDFLDILFTSVILRKYKHTLVLLRKGVATARVWLDDNPVSRMTLAWIRELAPVIIHINLPVIGEFLSFLGPIVVRWRYHCADGRYHKCGACSRLHMV